MSGMEFYPICGDCNVRMNPVWFKEEECGKNKVLTGRVRIACSHFVCPLCLRNACVDDTFDGPWYDDSVKSSYSPPRRR